MSADSGMTGRLSGAQERVCDDDQRRDLNVDAPAAIASLIGDDDRGGGCGSVYRQKRSSFTEEFDECAPGLLEADAHAFVHHIPGDVKFCSVTGRNPRLLDPWVTRRILPLRCYTEGV